MLFRSAGEQIGKIRGMLGPGMALFGSGVKILNSGDIETGLALMKEGVGSLVGVIYNQLSAAWFSFMEKVSWVYDIFRKIVVVSYEIGAAIAGSVGVALNNVFGRFGRLFGGEINTGDTITAMITLAAQFTASIIPGLYSAFLRFESILAQFILDLQAAFPLIASGGAKDRLRNTVLANEASVAALMNIIKDSFKNIGNVMGLPSEVDFKRRKHEAEQAAKENVGQAQRGLLGAKPIFDTTELMVQIEKNRAAMAKSAATSGAGPDMAKALSIISSFVGSAQASRGNLLQAINVEKANQEAIKDNTKRAADELEDINARGGQLVFTS